VRRWSGVRSRLLLAFVLVALPPLALLTVAVNALLSRTFEQASARRLSQALVTVQAELDHLRQQAQQRVAAVADQDLPSAPTTPDSEPLLAALLARHRDLEALEIVDAQNRVVSSQHWPAGFGLADRDQVFTARAVSGAPPPGTFRVERAAEGYGDRERLTVTVSRNAVWHGADVVVRGGSFVDGDLLARLSAAMGVEVAVRDTARRRWFAPARSPLQQWSEPGLEGGGERPEVALGGDSYRWAAAELAPELWLVVATPQGALLETTAGVRRLAMGVVLLAAGLAVAAAVVLSGRIARPVRELAGAAHALAAGESPRAVPASGPDEVAELASAFNLMTEQLRESRERLLQAERVAAWREMARRLAHELKNPIFPIQLSIETLRRVLDQDADDPASFRALFLESSDTILEELRVLRKIIEEFSDFARMPRPTPSPLDLNALVNHTLDVYRPRADGVAVEADLAPDLPAVLADRDLVGRALGNLISNALDAMPAGGRLRVRTAAAAAGVTVEIEDSGPGLNEEQKTRLFTPYYTTKKGGTGLGLAIVQGIVSDHGGRIQVRSEPGEGTTFTLLFPAA
jgi:two-component system, NtrC family, nitrogen regulation sensor histidine kinase NtrY